MSKLMQLPLELREQIYSLAIQDTILQGPHHPYDQSLPCSGSQSSERFSVLKSLRLVSRQARLEVEQVFERDVLPHMVFYFFDDLPALFALRKKAEACSFLHDARFCAQSQIKETVCMDDQVDMAWDTFFISQKDGDLSYDEECGAADWVLEPTSTPENVTYSTHSPDDCACQGENCVPYTIFNYEPLANSLRLSSCVLKNKSYDTGQADGYIIYSLLRGKLFDIDFDKFDSLARERYIEKADDIRPPSYWDAYGTSDESRKAALRNELIDVGADWVVNMQRERCEMGGPERF